MIGHTRSEPANEPANAISSVAVSPDGTRQTNPAFRSLSLSGLKPKDSHNFPSSPKTNLIGYDKVAPLAMAGRDRRMTVSPTSPVSPRKEWLSSTLLPPSSPHHAGIKLGRSQENRKAANTLLLESKNQQLRGHIQRLRAARRPGTDPGHVDASFVEFSGLQKACMALVRVLAYSSNPNIISSPTTTTSAAARHGSVEETVERLEMLKIAATSAGAAAGGEMDGPRASFGGLDLSSNTEGGVDSGRRINNPWLATIREWRDLLQKLLEAHRTSLLETYQAYEREVTPEMIQMLLLNSQFRSEAIYKMRNSPFFKSFSIAPAYWPKYEARFRNYDNLQGTIDDTDRLLRWAEGEFHEGGEEEEEEGEREEERGNGEKDNHRAAVYEYTTIAPRGDTILEFTNHHDTPSHENDEDDGLVLRFRVSSHMLAETSPFFARQFSHRAQGSVTLEEPPSDYVKPYNMAHEGLSPLPPPRKVIFPDGTEAKLYSIPQPELNREGGLTILLHAAHMQHDKVPRAITFEQFVAVAEVCLRYECTSPLEVFVEHVWLPAWMDKAAENYPDGLLLISYVFGLRTLFKRMSKTVIMNLVDEEQLRRSPWPHKVKERIWAVRNAKLAQIYSACASAIQEYFQPPSVQPDSLSSWTETPKYAESLPVKQKPQGNPGISSPLSQQRISTFRQTFTTIDNPPSFVSLFSLSSAPRCPKRDHSCDAANLGWLLLVFNELHILGKTAVNPGVLLPSQSADPDQVAPPRRSLAQLLNSLRSIPSPPSRAHHIESTSGTSGGGSSSSVCDPATVLRAVVNDIYNSVSGLTLFDVDGKRHGWGLSKNKIHQPQSLLSVSLGVLGGDPNPVDDVGIVGVEEEEGEGEELLAVYSSQNPTKSTKYDTISTGVADTAASADDVPAEIFKEDVDLDVQEEPGAYMDDKNQGLLAPPITTTTTAAAAAIKTPPTFCPDEMTCLRILSFIDNFDDLYSVALTSRTFYTVFKEHELTLIRRLIRTQRRLTLQMLTSLPIFLSSTGGNGGSGPGFLLSQQEEDKSLRDDQQLLTTPDTFSDVSDSACIVDEGEEQKPTALTLRYGDGRSLWEEKEEEKKKKERAASSLLACKMINHQSKQQQQQQYNGETKYSVITEEEACRILWPDQPLGGEVNIITRDRHTTTHFTTSSIVRQRGDENNDENKSLVENFKFVEDKTLVVLGDKSLREQVDRRKGIRSA